MTTKPWFYAVLVIRFATIKYICYNVKHPHPEGDKSSNILFNLILIFKAFKIILALLNIVHFR